MDKRSLEDEELAAEVRQLQKTNLTGEALRHQLYETISRRVKNLMCHISPYET
jgi:hypothetical protein